MGLIVENTERVALFEAATAGGGEETKKVAYESLLKQNPGMASLVDVYRKARELQEKEGITQPATVAGVKEKYADIFELAHKWSNNERPIVSGTDVEYAAKAFNAGKGIAGIEKGLSGEAAVQETLKAQANVVFRRSFVPDPYNKNNTADSESEKLRKMNPELNADVQQAVKSYKENGAKVGAEAMLEVSKKLDNGEYNQYGISKAASDYNKLISLEKPTEAEKAYVAKAAQENPIIVPYVAAYNTKRSEMEKSGNTIDSNEQKELDNLKQLSITLIKAEVTYPQSRLEAQTQTHER